MSPDKRIARFKKGIVMHGCRTCDYDLCSRFAPDSSTLQLHG